MSSQLDRMVPLFDGSNYRTLATSMTAFLHSQCLWGIVSGREGRPLDLPLHFVHPSKDVLQKAAENTSNFPKDIKFPKHDLTC